MMMASSFSLGKRLWSGKRTVELVFFISLTVALNCHPAQSVQEANVKASPPAASNASPTAQSSKNKHPRKRRRVRKSQKSMQQTNSAAEQTHPATETPNRVEIDPGDIPPSQRRNPDVDDRTKIPENIDPGDRVPPASIPKQRPKKPGQPRTS